MVIKSNSMVWWKKKYAHVISNYAQVFQLSFVITYVVPIHNYILYIKLFFFSFTLTMAETTYLIQKGEIRKKYVSEFKTDIL